MEIELSFASMPLYTGDYLRDTRHLSPLRHGVYLLALMHCWDSKGPIPLDEQEAAGICNCRSTDEVEALRYILERYFIRMDDGWYNKRMAEEVAKWEGVSKARSNGGLMSANVRREKARLGARSKIEHKLNMSSTQVKDKSESPSPSLSLKTKEKTKTHSRFAAREYLLNIGVDEQTVADWLAIRKEKKLVPTKAAIAAIEKEAEKAGKTLCEAVQICSREGWAGFKASWLTNLSQSESKQYTPTPWDGAVGFGVEK